jgi:hypothetical protein
MFYAPLTVFDPITGTHRVQRILLMDRGGGCIHPPPGWAFRWL